jgi:hypothetical protein
LFVVIERPVLAACCRLRVPPNLLVSCRSRYPIAKPNNARHSPDYEKAPPSIYLPGAMFPEHVVGDSYSLEERHPYTAHANCGRC